MKARLIPGLGRAAAMIAGAAAVVVVACSTANMTAYAPVNEQTKYSEDTLLSAAEHAAEELGLQVNEAEGSAGFDTREKEVATSSIPRLSYKFSFHVETTGGLLVIQANCSKNSTTSESEFSDCGDDRPKRVVELQAALRKKTLERARTEQDNSPDWSNFGKSEEAADAGKPAAKDDSKDKASDEKGGDEKKSESKEKEGKDKASSKSKDKTKKK